MCCAGPAPVAALPGVGSGQGLVDESAERIDARVESRHILGEQQAHGAFAQRRPGADFQFAGYFPETPAPGPGIELAGEARFLRQEAETASRSISNQAPPSAATQRYQASNRAN